MTSQNRMPLAFVQGTGLVLQTIGGIMAIGFCCAGSFGANAFGSAVEDNATLLTVSQLELFLSFAAGLAYLATGLGMQHARHSAAIGASVVASGMTIFWITALAIGATHDVRAAAWVIGAVALLINAVLAIFCLCSTIDLFRAKPSDFETIISQVNIEDLSEDELNKPIH